MDERSCLGTVSKREYLLWNARARNGYVEATLNHPFPAQVRNAYVACESLGPQKYDFARSRFLGIKTLQAIANLKRQLLEALHFAGLVKGRGLRARDVEILGRRAGDTDGVRAALAQNRDALLGPRGPPQPNPPSDAMLAALLCAALFPQLAYVDRPDSKKTKLPCAPENIKLLVRDPDGGKAEPQRAQVHPSSVASKLNGATWRTPFMVFHERVRTTKVYVRDATPVPPLAPFLLSGNRLDHQGDCLTLDGWLSTETEPKHHADLVVRLREKIDGRVADLLRGNVDSPDSDDLRHCLEVLCAQVARPEPKRPKHQPKQPKKPNNNAKKRAKKGRGRGGNKWGAAHARWYGPSRGGADW